MAKKEDYQDEEATIIEFEDEAGQKLYYEEETTLTVDGKRYAILLDLAEPEEGEEEEPDAIIAKIVKNEAGEDEYIEPTDEEFDLVEAAYNALLDEEEEK